jgi:hypothetical protein
MTEESKIVFTDADTGCYLSGHMGWHNEYRAIDLAEAHGFTMEDSEHDIVDRFRRDVPELTFSEFDYVHELCDAATNHLQSVTESGLYWSWDMGELSLVPACRSDGWDPNDECEHCERAGVPGGNVAS